MEITANTLRLFAAKNYENTFCLNETEFMQDLNRSSIVKKMLTKYDESGNLSLHLLVNNVISFFNVFGHHAATRILEFKIDPIHYKNMNSVLMFLSYPTIEPHEFDNRLLISIRDLYK